MTDHYKSDIDSVPVRLGAGKAKTIASSHEAIQTKRLHKLLLWFPRAAWEPRTGALASRSANRGDEDEDRTIT
jgi:hypothetical protein